MIAISCNKDDDGGSSSGNSDAKEITSFAFTASDNEALEADIQGTINEDTNSIAVTVPYGTNSTALSPVVEVSQGATYDPEGAQDFTEPVTYTITAQNGTTVTYEVTVTVAPNSENEIVNFLFSKEDNEHLSQDIYASINEEENTITAVVQFGTDITSLTPTLEVSPEATVEPEGVQDFTEPVTYTVTAQDGTSAEYTVTVLVAENDDVQILSFQFLANANDALVQNVSTVINTDDHTITATVPYGTNITALVPAITTSTGASHTPEGAQDFTEPVTYTVTAADEETSQAYTVTVIVGENNEAEILGFQFVVQTQIINAVINTDDHTITATVPYGTNITALVSAITTSPGATYTPEGEQDFSSPVMYTITAADGETTQTYTVTVTTEEPTDDMELQWQALMDIYEASYSSGYQVYFLDWDINNSDVSTWEGVTTDADGYVTELILTGKIGSYQIPESIGNLIRLQVLNLVNNSLTELPSSIGNLTQLRQLLLGINELTELPSFIGELNQLQELRAAYNNLTELPIPLSNLNGLQILDIRYNNLSGAFPEWIGGLSELQYLDIRNNSLGALPDELMELENLTYIDLRDNDFGMLSGDLCEYLVGIEERFMDEGTCP